MIGGLMNLVWLGALIGCAVSGWTNGILVILALFVWDATLEVKAIRGYAKGLVAVFAPEADATTTEAQADALTATVLQRIQDETAQHCRLRERD